MKSPEKNVSDKTGDLLRNVDVFRRYSTPPPPTLRYTESDGPRYLDSGPCPIKSDPDLVSQCTDPVLYGFQRSWYHP